MNLPRELVERARSADTAAIDALIEAVWPDAYRLAFGILGQEHAAQDAAQEACVIAYRSIAQLRSADAFRTWFYRIVVREASRVARHALPLGEIPECAAEQSSDTLEVWDALSRLSAPLRETVVLRYFYQLSSREIGRILGVPDATVRFRLMSAKRRLRPLLDIADGAHDVPRKVRSHAV